MLSTDSNLDLEVVNKFTISWVIKNTFLALRSPGIEILSIRSCDLTAKNMKNTIWCLSICCNGKCIDGDVTRRDFLPDVDIMKVDCKFEVLESDERVLFSKEQQNCLFSHGGMRFFEKLFPISVLKNVMKNCENDTICIRCVIKDRNCESNTAILCKAWTRFDANLYSFNWLEKLPLNFICWKSQEKVLTLENSSITAIILVSEDKEKLGLELETTNGPTFFLFKLSKLDDEGNKCLIGRETFDLAKKETNFEFEFSSTQLCLNVIIMTFFLEIYFENITVSNFISFKEMKLPSLEDSDHLTNVSSKTTLE